MADYRIQLASHPDYEQGLIEIYVGDEFVAQISQEAGMQHALVEFGPSHAPTKVNLRAFEAGFAAAKDRFLRSNVDG